MTATYRVYQFLWGSLDWLFPPVCGGCKRVGYRWCPECQQQVRLLPEPVCSTCGLPLSRPGLCISCSAALPPFKALRSWLVFEGPIRQALHSLKYRRNVALGDALAVHLARFALSLRWPIDAVTAVPSGKQRLSERGYNQVALIARPLAEHLKKRYSQKILARARETRTQVGLAPAQRKQNVAGAFRANPTLVSGSNILVVDDVVTSGATLASCAEALRAAGAREVYALSLTRALPHHGFEIV